MEYQALQDIHGGLHDGMTEMAYSRHVGVMGDNNPGEAAMGHSARDIPSPLGPSTHSLRFCVISISRKGNTAAAVV